MAHNIITFSYDTIEANTGFLFWQLSHIWQYEQEKTLKKMFKITQLQYVILASAYWLTSHGMEVTQTFLSQHTKIEKMTLSKNLQILQERSYLHRKTYSSDLRANTVFLTEQGLDLLERAVKVIEEIDCKFFSPLGKSIDSFNVKLIALIKFNKKNLTQITFP
jgi:DNA-binding MarR family transcriptional regulator